MRLGFDEVYVIIHDGELWAECLYDKRKAQETAIMLRGYPETVEVKSLEEYANEQAEKLAIASEQVPKGAYPKNLINSIIKEKGF